MIVPYDFTPILGGDRSKQFSPADIRNMYVTQDASNQRIGWHDFPGLKRRTTDSKADRGHHVMNGVRYVITGTSLQSEDAYGVRTPLATVAGSERAIFTDDGSVMLICAQDKLYKWNGATLSDITSSLSITNPKWVAYFFNTFFVGNDSSWASSNVGDPDTWDSLDVALFDQSSDTLRRGYVFQGLLYLFGKVSTENWVYTGTGNPPLQRRGSTLQNIGIAGRYAVTNTDQLIYWLGDDRRVYKGSGTSAVSVNTPAVSEILQGYSYIQDCVMSSFTLKGQVFVMLRFPSAGDCLVYSESSDYWLTLSSGNNRYTRTAWLGTSVQQAYGKNLVTDTFNGHTYELDFDTYTDDGTERLRMLVGNPIGGDLIGKPQNQILFSALHIPMQVGVGLATGQGSNPKLICEISPSGGQIFETETFVDIGQSGDYSRKVMFHYFTTGYEIVPRVLISDPVPCTIYQGGSVDIMDAGY